MIYSNKVQIIETVFMCIFVFGGAGAIMYYLYTTPANICYQQYTDVKVIGQEFMHAEPDAQTSCLILQCFNEHNYNLTNDQLKLFASCKQTGLIK